MNVGTHGNDNTFITVNVKGVTLKILLIITIIFTKKLVEYLYVRVYIIYMSKKQSKMNKVFLTITNSYCLTLCDQ